MKKLTFFAIAALSLISVSCIKSQSPDESKGGDKFIMTLNADVIETSADVDGTKATIDDNWKFAFTQGDQISLTNDQTASDTYYTLTRDSGGNFTGEVTAPESDAYWYAYYPSSSVSLAGQNGTKDVAAAKYALAGKTADKIPALSKNLHITLHPQTAILVISNITGATININVRTSDGKFVSGLAATATADTASFSVTKSTDKVILHTSSSSDPQYVVVPAGVQIDIYDGDTKIKSTKTAGLAAGKYYNITFEVQDILNQDFIGITGSSYREFSGKTGTSGAIYAGRCSEAKNSIQLRSNNSNSGVITTKSGGKASKIAVEWHTDTADGRTLNVYGKNTAYSAATDLYNAETQGTEIGTIVKGESTELEVPDGYEFIGFRSNNGAMLLTSVTITWK